MVVGVAERKCATRASQTIRFAKVVLNNLVDASRKFKDSLSSICGIAFVGAIERIYAAQVSWTT